MRTLITHSVESSHLEGDVLILAVEEPLAFAGLRVPKTVETLFSVPTPEHSVGKDTFSHRLNCYLANSFFFENSMKNTPDNTAGFPAIHWGTMAFSTQQITRETATTNLNFNNRHAFSLFSL